MVRHEDKGNGMDWIESKLGEFRLYLEEHERAASTIDSYLMAAKIYFRRYEELSKANMIDFKHWLVESYRPKTAALRCVAMNVYCDFAGRPDCKVRGVKLSRATTVENVISMDEYEYLLARLAEDKAWKVYFMVKFLAGTGCRASELAKLKKSCLETGEFTMWTKGKIRKIWIPESLLAESRGFLGGLDTEFLFPNKYGEQISVRGIRTQIKRYGLRYGIRPEVLHPHAFRHMFAVQFLKNNQNIALLSDILGHESLSTTAIYLRLSAEEQKREVDGTVTWV